MVWSSPPMGNGMTPMLDTCIYLWIHPRIQLGLYSCIIRFRGVKYHVNTEKIPLLTAVLLHRLALNNTPAVWVLQPVTRVEGWLMADHPIPVSHGVVVKDLAKKLLYQRNMARSVCFFSAKIYIKRCCSYIVRGWPAPFYGSNLPTYDPFEF